MYGLCWIPRIPPRLFTRCAEWFEGYRKGSQGWNALILLFVSAQDVRIDRREDRKASRGREDGGENSVQSPVLVKSAGCQDVIMHAISSRSQNAHCSRGVYVCGRGR